MTRGFVTQGTRADFFSGVKQEPQPYISLDMLYARYFGAIDD